MHQKENQPQKYDSQADLDVDEKLPEHSLLLPARRLLASVEKDALFFYSFSGQSFRDVLKTKLQHELVKRPEYARQSHKLDDNKGAW